MTLRFDRRTELAGKAACHVFIVGVSNYKNLGGENDPLGAFGLKRLSSAALTGHRIYRWLLDHQDELAVPLGTVHLMLAPSKSELASEPDLKTLKTDCSFTAVKKEAAAWRNACVGNPDNLALFYFCGHGIQRTGDDSILLLQDFDAVPGLTMDGTVSSDNIFQGMSPTASGFPDIARQQLFFIDACREFPAEFKNTEKQQPGTIFTYELGGPPDKRRAPIFFAAVPGAKAYARVGKGTVFSEALIACLKVAAEERADAMGDPVYEFGTDALEDCLRLYFEALPESERDDQEISPAGLSSDVVIYRSRQPPPIPVFIDLQPPEQFGKIRFRFSANGAVALDHPRDAPTAAPLEVHLPLGTYNLDLDPLPPNVKFRSPLQIRPPRFRWPVVKQ